MAYGAVIASAHTKPLPEFFGDAALYYASGDAHSLADQLRVALNMPTEQRIAMQNAALARAHDFQWTETARRTVDELIQCVASTRRNA
jgi:glycosyltransferase involved in cell wall biosynthesis